MDNIYAWLVLNGTGVVAIWFAFEKMVNLIVGFTETDADDAMWEKIKNMIGWVLNTKSKAA